MSDHDPERLERRLIELLADDAAAAEAAFEASELAENAMCREIARKHIDLQRQLDGLGGDERQAIAKAGDEKSTEGKAEQAFRELVERETRGGVPAEDDPTHPAAARRAGPAPARGRLILGWIGAAAAVLLAVVVLRSREPDPNPPLGPGSTELAPTGEVEDFSRFSWTQDCPQGGWFRVLVEAETAEGLPERVYRSPRLEDNEWLPPREVHEAWPDSIIWTLEIYSGATADDLVDSARSSAQRSSP